MGTTTKERRRVKSLETLFEVVQVLKDSNGAGVTEIASEIGMAKSTVHRYLSTLEENDYVVKEDGEYHIGLRILSLGEFARNRKDYYRVAKSKIDQLAQETGERVQFIVEEHGRGVYIHREVGEHGVRTDAHIGKRTYLHTTAAGKAILAHMDASEVDQVVDRWGLPEMTENTIVDRDELDTELESIREQGYAVNREEHVKGLCGVAAPILDENGSPLGSVSIGGPKHRIDKKLRDGEIVSTVIGATNELELNIKYS